MTTAVEVPSEVVVVEDQTLAVRAAIAPSAIAAREALETYQQIQKVFDEKMPDAIMAIGNRKFRKKVYWRGIATAFSVSCEVLKVERIEIGDDWGYEAIVRAIAPDGRTSDGDGSCMASEKWTTRPQCPGCGSSEFSFRSNKSDGKEFYCWRKKGGCGNEWDAVPGAEVGIDKSQATLHNIRSHAVTRAKNRAISDLVGFGEVSADELPSGAGDDPPAAGEPAARSRPKKQAPLKGDVKIANEKQLGMLKAKSYSRAEELGEGSAYENKHEYAGAIRKAAKHMLGLDDAGDEIPFAAVTPLAKAIEAAELGADGEITVPEGGAF